MIVLDSVGKSYPARGRRQWVFRHLTWTVERGQRWALFGANGQGKSTLLRVVAGAEDPCEGRVVRRMSVSWPLAFGGGFQGGLTGADNIRFIARLYGVEERRAVEQAEAFAKLGTQLDEPFMTYSSGMRARLAFAASLVVDFDCLLVDEVLAVGDASFRQRCQSALQKMTANKALIMTTHMPEIARDYCDRSAVLDGGRLYTYTNVDDGIAHYYQLMQAAALA